MQCNFESSMCGWTSDKTTLKHSLGQITATKVWKLLETGQARMPKILYDKSSSVGNGNFAYIHFAPAFSSSSSSSFDSGLLISPPFSSAQSEELSFTFWLVFVFSSKLVPSNTSSYCSTFFSTLFCAS
ncbi:hypothetical protein HELRODRAFT_171636 [Helobdella robusta]|uniref:MAM domain-containing protein n=1 Tax=Helobdella robusta TaxID=6412 RepID=T1F4H6_HELRO|nr:hypothetical protein HELRODRAFT_171636 [Helobdella robusta]ESO05277.1 hypothetical protein HELRODRAFT_171636 [Helobdella robusta]